ncbi:MAG: flagellar protein FliT [Gammaproteobacteria bacterium]|nr:flagellar protein FliT [Gammaproteobacteria bacterium]
MNIVTIDKLTELLSHNKQMLKDAEAGNWEKLTVSESIRQRLIEDYFSVKIDPHDETVVAATQNLLKVNERIKELASKARDHVTKSLVGLEKGKVAVNAYAKHMA